MKKVIVLTAVFTILTSIFLSSNVYAFTEQRKFIGEEYDAETGLNYLNARYYDARIGRFVSQDPMFWQLPTELLADPQQLNSYSYARNNPIIYSDATGLIPTVKEAAVMASQIYQNGNEGDNLSGGWNYDESYTGKDAMKMGAYSRMKEGGNLEYALVSKGTTPSSTSDWKNNIEQIFGMSSDLSSAIGKARDFVNSHSNNEITFVGYSKGAPEAEASALIYNKNAILFNPAPLTLSAEMYGASNNYTSHITEYIIRGDIINLTLNRFASPLSSNNTVIFLPSQHRIQCLCYPYHPQAELKQQR